MFGLTTLGIIHTAISIVAVIAGAIALIGEGKISLANTLGKTYAVATVLTCLTALGIYRHGGFGGPHVLAILTILVLGAGWLAESRQQFGAASFYVAPICYSFTFLFHLIPALTETTTRLPYGSPLFASPEAPGLKAAIGALVLLFVVAVALQVGRLRRAASAINS